MGLKYPHRLNTSISTKPFFLKGATLRLRCDIYPSEDFHRDTYLVFYLQNEFESTQSCTIDTIYIYNAGDLKITELGALLDHKWKIPLKGARTGDSARFISTLKSGIVRAAMTFERGINSSEVEALAGGPTTPQDKTIVPTSISSNPDNLYKFIRLALDCCQTELIYMDAIGDYFKVGTPSRTSTVFKELISKKAPTSIGNKINKVISASETEEELAPGDQFIFAAARLNPRSDTIEFTNDLKAIFGNKDYREYDALLQSESEFLAKNAVIDEQTKEKKYNKLYTAATDWLKYSLIKQGITTAGEVGKSIAES